jgi:cytochrome c oxidase cbb3-type subunit 3
MMRAASIVVLSVWVAAFLHAQAPAPASQNPAPATPPAQAPPPAGQRGGRQGSPASQRPPQTVTQQTYSAEQVRAGQAIFLSQCGFCHGRDAMGGETGPDLTRSAVVAEDVKGDKIGPVVRSGRPEKGMPANTTLSETDLASVVAFIHEQKRKADANEGDRRTVDVSDLQTGNAQAGEQYFNGAGGCSKCHTPTGDFAGLATRLQGLQLLQRMLYPGGRGRGGRPPYTPTVTVTPLNGQPVTGRLAYRDEFTVGLTDETGWYRSWPTKQVKYVVDDKLEAHAAQLPKYTDADIHNVLAYLQTLK